MNTIPEILTYPNGTPVEAVQAKIGKVYEYRQVTTKFGKKSAQNFTLEDGAGNAIRATIWEHPDLGEHEGKEYVFSGGRGGKGIVVKHDSYVPKGQTAEVRTVELSISKAGQLQWVEVFHRDNPGKALPSPAKAPNTAQVGQDSTPPVKSPYTPINGAKVGMALNNAVLLLAGADRLAEMTHDQIMGEVKSWAIAIIRLSNDLESGRIAIEAPAPEAKPAATTPAKDEDRPF